MLRPRSLPDFLSILRVPASLLLIAVYEPHAGLRFAIAGLIVAIIVASDVADGKIARSRAIQSKHGYLMDGWGDRAFHVAIYLISLDERVIGLGITWILVFREVSVYAVRNLDSSWYSTQTRIERRVDWFYAGLVRALFLADMLHVIVPSQALETLRPLIVAYLCALAIASYVQLARRFLTIRHQMTDG